MTDNKLRVGVGMVGIIGTSAPLKSYFTQNSYDTTYTHEHNYFLTMKYLLPSGSM